MTSSSRGSYGMGKWANGSKAAAFGSRDEVGNPETDIPGFLLLSE